MVSPRANAGQTQRLMFFDIFLDPSLAQLKKEKNVLTRNRANELARSPNVSVMDQGTRDNLWVQRKMKLKDCNKAECRFTMARSLPGMDLMVEASIDPLNRWSGCMGR